MEYELIYDIRQVGYEHWWLILLFIGITITFILAAIFRDPLNKILHAHISKRMAWLGVILMAFITVMNSISSLLEHKQLLAALENNKALQIKGQIAEYIPERQKTGTQSGRWESFVVGNVKFNISGTQAGYRTTQKDGSPLREGDQVRISYLSTEFGLIILRLEKAK